MDTGGQQAELCPERTPRTHPASFDLLWWLDAPGWVKVNARVIRPSRQMDRRAARGQNSPSGGRILALAAPGARGIGAVTTPRAISFGRFRTFGVCERHSKLYNSPFGKIPSGENRHTAKSTPAGIWFS